MSVTVTHHRARQALGAARRPARGRVVGAGSGGRTRPPGRRCACRVDERRRPPHRHVPHRNDRGGASGHPSRGEREARSDARSHPCGRGQAGRDVRARCDGHAAGGSARRRGAGRPQALPRQRPHPGARLRPAMGARERRRDVVRGLRPGARRRHRRVGGLGLRHRRRRDRRGHRRRRRLRPSGSGGSGVDEPRRVGRRQGDERRRRRRQRLHRRRPRRERLLRRRRRRAPCPGRRLPWDVGVERHRGRREWRRHHRRRPRCPDHGRPFPRQRQVRHRLVRGARHPVRHRHGREDHQRVVGRAVPEPRAGGRDLGGQRRRRPVRRRGRQRRQLREALAGGERPAQPRVRRRDRSRWRDVRVFELRRVGRPRCPGHRHLPGASDAVSRPRRTAAGRGRHSRRRSSRGRPPCSPRPSRRCSGTPGRSARSSS